MAHPYAPRRFSSAQERAQIAALRRAYRPPMSEAAVVAWFGCAVALAGAVAMAWLWLALVARATAAF